ncbi:ROK family protein [Altericista sp. CCNU0014]|uniref:ROK family protein n=1 Tax=Altericista sp. CCNU0014 TaxID=3082949 RepID=UPI00384FF476
MADRVIGVDLGGTDIKLGCYTREGHCLASLKIATPQSSSPDPVIAGIAAAIRELDPEKEAIALGVGAPGPADVAGRVSKLAINLPGWVSVPLADRLEALTGLPTVVGNDANCAGLGEAWLGAGRHFQNWILLTLGTGVGGAVFIDGQLFVGHNGTAGELGLVTVDLNGPTCNSGNRGSLEQHASAQAIRRRTGFEPSELAERAAAGNPEAIDFWQQYGRELAAGITSTVYVLAPQAVIIGGGICAAWDFFLPTLETEVRRRVKPTSREGLQIAIAELGNQAGMAGAARLAWQSKFFC